MEIALTLFTTLLALVALAFWWIRRNNLAVYPAGRGPLVRQPLPTGCDLGARLMAAAAVESSGGGTGTTGGGTGGGVATPAPPAPPRRQKRTKPARKLPTRREFFRYGLLASAGGMLAAFGGASLGFLWPSLRGGFGAKIELGDPSFVAAQIAEGGGRFEFPAGRMYVVAYDAAADADGVYTDITNDSGFMALYQKCVHLGCRVPWCESSSWFECPCHGSRYNRWGEYRFGPAPRGLDRFAVTVENGNVVVDTATTITGPSRTTNVLVQAPEGPHCN